MAKILVVDDDKGLLRMIRDWLMFEHHLVETSDSGSAALDRLGLGEYDAIVLDWDLPEMSGIEVMKEFRARGGTTPILMLTGKGSIRDKEEGFSYGADDYLTKPFDMKELALRVRALIRRSGGSPGDIVKFREIVLESANHRVFLSGTEVHLQPSEFCLLEFLMRYPNQVFSAEVLLSRVWSSDSDASIDAVSTCIKRLRKKLDVDRQPSIIRTVHGVGYGLASS